MMTDEELIAKLRLRTAGMHHERNYVYHVKEDTLAIKAADAIERLKRERDDARAAWQPISTAPKDETHILVCGPDKNGGTYQSVCAWPRNWSGMWPVAYMAYAAGEPTHWMPLPQPPKEDGDE
jgi:hypothetical protein